MCVGAMVHARLARVVYGATDPKTGACGSIVDLPGLATFNHHGRFEGGVLVRNAGTPVAEPNRIASIEDGNDDFPK